MTLSVSALYDRYVAWHPDHRRGPVKSLSELQCYLHGSLCEEIDFDPEERSDGFLCFTMDEVYWILHSDIMTPLV